VAVVVPEQPVAAEPQPEPVDPFVEAAEPAQEQVPAEQVPVLVDAGRPTGTRPTA
jgi:hypothetical protein